MGIGGGGGVQTAGFAETVTTKTGASSDQTRRDYRAASKYCIIPFPLKSRAFRACDDRRDASVKGRDWACVDGLCRGPGVSASRRLVTGNKAEQRLARAPWPRHARRTSHPPSTSLSRPSPSPREGGRQTDGGTGRAAGPTAPAPPAPASHGGPLASSVLRHRPATRRATHTRHHGRIARAPQLH